MDIAILSNKLNSDGGGSNISLHLMANYLIERGHQVKIITFNVFGENNIPADHRYDVEPYPTQSHKLAYKFPKKLQEIDDEFDVFHIFEPLLAPFGGIYKKTGGETPVVCRLNAYSMFCSNAEEMDGECHKNCTIRDKFAHDKGSLKTRVSRSPYYIARNYAPPALVNNIDMFFAISPQIKGVYTENGIDGDLVRIIPNFYNPEFIRRDSIESSIPSSEKNILFVGRLRNEKGVDILMDALSSIDESIRVDIVGNGPRREALEQTAEVLPQDVHFHGWIDHEKLPQYYDDSDMFIHAGRWPEPFGRTILEALQHQCPPVVSNIGAPPWIISDAGESFENKNPVSLAQSVNRLFDENLLPEKKKACEKRLTKFEPERVIDKLEKSYQEVQNTP